MRLDGDWQAEISVIYIAKHCIGTSEGMEANFQENNANNSTLYGRKNTENFTVLPEQAVAQF